MSDANDALKDCRIGFIGCGAMAQALAGGLLAAGVGAENLSGSDPFAAGRDFFENELGIATHEDNAALIADRDVIVMCVKPGLVASILDDLAGGTDLARPLWISIAAGVSLGKYAERLPDRARVVRVMPNTPALVRAGASAICPNSHSTQTDLAIAEALFASVGTTWTTRDEGLIDAVTGLSGSGPAYVFLIMEALGDAGVRQGLPRDAAYQLAFQTVMGAAKLAIETGEHPGVLKDRVTSPGGTTIAGLEQLESGGVRASIYEAVAAATRRSRELAG